MSHRIPLYRTVQDALEAEIRSGCLAKGAELPSEKRLCERFGVSRITVRRALERLGQAGLISRASGRATRVTEPRLSHALVAFEDPFGPLRLVRGTTVRLLGFEWRLAEGTVARALRVDDGDQVLRILRVRERDGEPVFHTAVWLPAKVGALVNRKALDGDALHDVLSAAGCEPATVERQMSADPCPAEIAGVLKLAPDAPTFRVDRLTRAADGAPLHLLVGHWRWDRFNMRLTSGVSAEPGRLSIQEAEADPTLADDSLQRQRS